MTSDGRDLFLRDKLIFVLVVFLLFMGLAHGAAQLTDAVSYYRIRFTLAAAVILLIPAYGFYILRRPSQGSAYWLLFWTFGYLAYLVHAAWAYLLPPFGDAAASGFGLVLVAVLLGWWGADLLFAWAAEVWGSPEVPRLVQLQRGVLHTVIFGVLVALCLSTPGALLPLLAVLLILAVFLTFAIRIAKRRLDPGALSARLYRGFFAALNGAGIPWYRLPTFLGVMNLGALRDVLREKNLVGTNDIPVTNPVGRDPYPPPPSARDLYELNFDGYYNDLRRGKWEMGSASTNSHDPASPSDFDRSNPGSRFGRNVPRHATYPNKSSLLEPSPREISRHLLARDSLKEATILNFLAAAWIQFETHDWFFHGNPVTGNEFKVRLTQDDAWDPATGAMIVRRTRPDPTRDYTAEARQLGPDKVPPPTYANAGTHWWDASQIYGDDTITMRRLRTPPGEADVLPDGLLYLEDNKLPLDPSDPTRGVELTGFNGNWWLGLTLLHTLFVREHNAICGHLRREYSRWSGERIFQTARLVNAALMAKIHTVEWTPAILPNPCLQTGMNANWWGLAGEPIKKTFGRISENEATSGIPGSAFNHHAADYSLTEEFVSVYRMHPLMRDMLEVYSVSSGEQIDAFRIEEVIGPLARTRGLDRADLGDLFYSFGIAHPGALTLRNFPNFLRDLRRPDGDRVDLATIDILRDRERGVPRPVVPDRGGLPLE